MSSFNVHKKHALNESEPINHRFSHLRSCLNKVANFKSISRNELIEIIIKETGVDVNKNTNEKELFKALKYIEKIKNKIT